ncbi:hypothetical protein A3A93_05445 [Candidatus Roizmanbacteria bacterium RIFCSPLOWO2_01_FULL_38_12]|uniref:Transcription regulator TrmB N-terminal domain-containing protein n=1 Tax=Candidatus Roizmanbacteria bacterium RIFCSPLOWO2_01_FULL_38_12 TaxID=1802061 RepID=A0A1F7IZ66_9BACT|nr:MAG: hypothetical protein A2861_03660 [Candidatus Roizmanbacteria bacterium RIFCSPHIGHO2_01_FULL_38_15]OGK35665.1 MAG: hypothetical protein A3F59_01875 [Candidatus Roizmanbacteria bacterium RIFCSPHIGHO2_12_FULL_38_13]OGK48631.1 MAG: hypothetical protein A3A93_05445 [Candidatus Roizmanbacteria bacterium RIFCSPLOWO2_01_FULL_38_12]
MHKNLTVFKKNELLDYLGDLGFDKISAKLYVSLVEKGPCTISELSRTADIERTKLYRILNKLLKKGVIEEIVEYKRRFLKAADINNLEYIVQHNLRRAQNLSNLFFEFSQTIDHLKQKDMPTSVQFYRGREGIKQMLWNELSAKTESLCFIYKIFDTFVGQDFFDHWASEFGKRNLRSREIRTELFDQSYADCPNEICFKMKNVKIRYIKSKKIPITHGMTIYDNVVAIYDFWEDQIFGVEIYNQKVAEMQRIFFESYWKKARLTSAKNHLLQLNKIIREY